MITIVHVINSLEIGGAETMLVKLARGTDRARFRTIVVSMTGPGVLGAELETTGIPVFSLGMRRGMPDPRGFFRLLGLLRQMRPQIIQTWLYHADLLGLAAGTILRTPSVVWNIRCSNMDQDYPLRSRLVRAALVHLSSYPAAVIVNAVAAQHVHRRFGYRPKRWEVVPNGFDLDKFRPDPSARVRLRHELQLPEKSVLIGLPARYHPMKDHATFLAGARLLARRHLEVAFLAIGHEVHAENRWLSGRVAELGLAGRVHLLGERHDMPRLLAGLDIVTLASAYGEGFPNVLGEAMASGVPCIATDVGDAGLIISDTGFMVPPRDPAALAAAWEELLALGPEGRGRLGLAARQRIAENFSLARIIGRYQTLYAELAERGEQTPRADHRSSG